MNKKDTKLRNKVIKDMKECFRSLHLHVEKGKKEDSYDFMSIIDTQSVLSHIYVEYRENFEWVGINFSFGVMGSTRIVEVLKLINLINRITPHFYYSLCPCCNELIVHAHLPILGKKLPKDKFNWLIRYLLETTYFAYPLFGLIIAMGRTPEECYGRYKDSLQNIVNQGSDLNKEMKQKGLTDLISIFADLEITITDYDKTENGFLFQYVHPDDQGILIHISTALDSENRSVEIHVVSSFTVPDEKMTTILELVNRINRICGYEHLFIDDQSKRNVFVCGIRLDNGIISKEEFLNAFKIMIQDALSWFPIIQELVTFGGIPTELIRKRIPCYNDQTTMH